jgi:hypothetical protein
VTQPSTTASPPKGPVFIVGAPRSGTTLLQYRLRNHPRSSLPTGESHFFIPLLAREAEFGDLRDAQNIARVLQAMHRQSKEFLETDLQFPGLATAYRLHNRIATAYWRQHR